MAGDPFSLLAGLGPIGKAIDQHVNRACTNALPPSGTLVEAFRRGALDENQLRRGLKSQGFSDTAIDAILASTEFLLSPEQLNILRDRGEISQQEYEEELKKNGFSDDAIINFDKYHAKIMTPDDALYLMRQGKMTESEYKDVLRANSYGEEYIANALDINKFHFDPTTQATIDKRSKIPVDSLQALGISLEPSADFLATCKARGMTDQQAKDLWLSQQPLPSAQDIVTLLDRKQISDKTARDLLKGNGMSDAQIALMLAANKTLIPSRTAATMFLNNGMSEDDLYNQLIANGYSPEQAKMFTDYYAEQKRIKDEKEAAKVSKQKKAATDKASGGGSSKPTTIKNKDISLGLIKSAWQYQEISTDEAIGLINDLGFEAWETALQISVWEAELAEKDRKDSISLATEQYKIGAIDEAGYRDALGKLNVKASVIDLMIMKNTSTKVLNEKLPSVAQLQKWLRKGSIDDDTFIYYMQRHNYSQDIAEIYYTEAMEKKE